MCENTSFVVNFLKSFIAGTTEQEVKKKKEEQVEEVPFTSKSEALTEISNIESCDTTQINIKNEIVDIKRMVEPVDNADKFTIDPLIEQEAALTLGRIVNFSINLIAADTIYFRWSNK